MLNVARDGYQSGDNEERNLLGIAPPLSTFSLSIPSTCSKVIEGLIQWEKDKRIKYLKE
jgi:hypothetical protein